MIIDFIHIARGVKVVRISDGKTLAVISDKFKIKYKNGGESLFIVKKTRKI